VVIHNRQYNLPRLTEKPLCIFLIRLLYSQSPSQEDDVSCYGTTHLHCYLAICENSPFNGLLYAELEVFSLYSHEHKGNYAPIECIGGHFNEIITPLIMLVHPYRTEIKMGVNWLKKTLLSKRTNGGDPLRRAK